MLASYFNLLFLGKLVGMHQGLVFEPCDHYPSTLTTIPRVLIINTLKSIVEIEPSDRLILLTTIIN